MSSEFSSVPSLPEHYEGLSIEYRKSTPGFLISFGTFGNKNGDPLILKTPRFHSAVSVVNTLNSKNIFHQFISSSGSVSTHSDIIGTAVTFTFRLVTNPKPDDGFISNRLFGNENLGASFRWYPSPSLDPWDRLDLLNTYNNIIADRAANNITLNYLNSNILLKTQERDELELTKDREELIDYETRIRNIASIVGLEEVQDVDVILRELNEFRVNQVDVFRSLNFTLDNKFTDQQEALDYLSTIIVAHKKFNNGPTSLEIEYEQLNRLYDDLVNNSYPARNLLGTINAKYLDRLRTRILDTLGEVPDFSSELEIIGFLTAKKTTLIEEISKIQERLDKPDIYQSLRNDLTSQLATIRAKISNFTCDLKELYETLRIARLDKIRKSATLDYKNNAGFRGRNYESMHCRDTRNSGIGWSCG